MPAAAGLDAHDVGRTRVLERDDRRHQLRDARDRTCPPRVSLREHAPVLADEVPGRGVDARSILRGGDLDVGSQRGSNGDDRDERSSANHRAGS